MDPTLQKLQKILPSPLFFLLSEHSEPPEELRMRVGHPVILKQWGRCALTHLVCTEDLMKETLSCCTNRSFYSHSDTILEGYISLPGGVRAGICGKAVCKEGKILSVKDISFLSLRIPRPVPGAADPLLNLLRSTDFRKGMLMYSPPGMGKTTVLRELARKLSSPPYLLSTALLDQRGELSAGLEDCPSLSVYLYYPKEKALSMALRTAAPDLIILDEIGKEECAGLAECGKGGVAVIASAHAAGHGELLARPGIAALLQAGMFDYLVGIERTGTKLSFEITETSNLC